MSNIYEFNVNGDIYGLNVPSVSRKVLGEDERIIWLNPIGGPYTLDPLCIRMITFTTNDGMNWVCHREYDKDQRTLLSFSAFGYYVSKKKNHCIIAQATLQMQARPNLTVQPLDMSLSPKNPFTLTFDTTNFSAYDVLNNKFPADISQGYGPIEDTVVNFYF